MGPGWGSVERRGENPSRLDFSRVSPGSDPEGLWREGFRVIFEGGTFFQGPCWQASAYNDVPLA